MRHLVTTVAAVGLLASIATAAHAEPMIIKFSHVVAEATPKGIGANAFAACSNEKLAGKVNVQVYPSSQLFSDDKVLEAMLLGDVQFAAPSLSKFDSFTKKLQIFDLPFLFNDLAAVDRFQQSAAGQKLLESMEDKGLRGVAYWHNGLKQMSANVPLRTPADAKGLKFRIQSSDVLAAQFEAVGGVPIKKPFSEVFTMLQTKAIDGTENPWSNAYSQKFFEVQKYISETDHGLLDYLVVTNADWWNDLPDDIRSGLSDCMAVGTKASNDESLKLAMEYRQKIIDSGASEVVPLTAEEKNAWREAMKPVWAEFEDAIGKDLIEAAAASNQGS